MLKDIVGGTQYCNGNNANDFSFLRTTESQISFWVLTLSNPIFLPTAYSPALICFEQERGWWITCNYPTVLKEKNIENQKEYNLCCLLAKVHTTWGKASDRPRQRVNKLNKNGVGHLPTLERSRKIILSDEVWHRIGKGLHCTPCKWHRVNKEKRSGTVCEPEIFRDPKHWPLKACKGMRGSFISS
jgi:hypothetical protein